MRALPALALLLLSACQVESKCGPSKATVVNVVDGDTIDLDVDDLRVRMLLVDTPETTGGKDDCYGQEARAYTSLQLQGAEVTLEYDEAGCFDDYGRALAYVSVDGLEINAELVKRGLACALHIPPAGDDRAQEFKDYQLDAQNDRKGMWGVCSEIPCAH